MVVSNVCDYLNQRFPSSFAEDFDLPSIGLAIGLKTNKVSNILLALDLTKEVVLEAIDKKCNLIITHHPFLFRPINKVLFDDEKGEVIRLMAIHNISLYSAHTNLDVGSGGVNDTLANLLDIKDIKTISEVGKGCYLRYGEIDKITLFDLVQKIKKIFNLSGVRVLGSLDKEVTKIGIVGGSGAHTYNIKDAKDVNLDCYITGEVSLSSSITANYLDLSIIEVSHGIEKFVFSSLIKELKEEFLKLYKFKNKIIISSTQTDKMITI